MRVQARLIKKDDVKLTGRQTLSQTQNNENVVFLACYIVIFLYLSLTNNRYITVSRVFSSVNNTL